METWKDIAEFGVIKKSFFSEFLDLSNGIPSHDTFARVFSRIDPVEFEESFYEWQKQLHDSLCGDVVAIDEKTLRGARDKSSNKSAIHMVSAWSTIGKNSLPCDVKNILPRTPNIVINLHKAEI